MGWEDIGTKVAELGKLDRTLGLFGAKEHKYSFHPALQAKQVTQFEKKHRIELPEEYAEFLSTLGNGGAGPFYGIFRLGEMDLNWDYGPWIEGYVGELNLPFPYVSAWVPDGPEEPEFFASDDEEDAFNQQWDDVLGEPIPGAVPICHHGCARRTWLVVSGPERGNVWYDERADRGGLLPHLVEKRHQSFADWYQTWLNRSFVELARKR